MIFETSRKKEYPTLKEFQDDILDNKLELVKTVVAGWHILRYKGCGEGAKEIYFNLANNEIPMIDGKRVDYAPAMVFDSPYLKSMYGSGVVTIQVGNEKSILDFN